MDVSARKPTATSFGNLLVRDGDGTTPAEAAGLLAEGVDHVRRGDGPAGARWYNFAALTTTERLIDEQPQIAAAAYAPS